MTQILRKSIQELLAISSAEVRTYLETLSVPERKRVSTELYRAKLRLDTQKNRNYPKLFSTKSQ
jgi:hypothetical protein